MKKYLAILLTAAMLLCAAPLAGFTAIQLPEINFGSLFPNANAAEIVDSGTCGEVDEETGLDGSQVTWTLDSDGLLTVSGTGNMKDYYSYDSPWLRNALVKTIIIQSGVASIGAGAFEGCTGLTAVTIPDSVTSIGGVAFRGCRGLTSVTIPVSVTSAGNSAFAGCTGLTSVVLSDSMTTIEHALFFLLYGFDFSDHTGWCDKYRIWGVFRLHWPNLSNHPGQRNKHRRIRVY